jgi:hypothetical protein
VGRAVQGLVLLAMAVGLCVGPSHAAPVVWVAPSLVRVGPQAQPGTATRLTVRAAKGETESFQILVRAQAGGLTNVRVAGSFTGGVPITLYREHYVYVSKTRLNWPGSTNRAEGPGWYPDGLIPAVDRATGRALQGELRAMPVDVAGGQNVGFWVDATVPRDQRAGDYQGTFTVTTDQGKAAVTVDLHVWNFELPLRPYLKSCFLYWPTDSHGAGRGQTQPDEELLRHRLMPISINPANEARFIREFGLNSISAGFWSGADNTTGKMRAAPSAHEFTVARAKHAMDLFVYNYTADEIGPNPALHAPMREWARNMHHADIHNLVTMAPLPELSDDGEGRSAVDVWVVLPKMYDESRDAILAALKRGDEVWSYNAVVQDNYSPKWQLDFAPIDYRIQTGFINQSLGLTGLLYWRVDDWSKEPWKDVMAYSGYPGEGMLVYPGAPVGVTGVVPSMRLKYLRDGVDDYDYVQLLRAKGQGDWALDVVRTVGRDWHDWTQAPEALEAARVKLGERLSGG